MQVPKYQAIEAILRDRILSGTYAPGSKLPPQGELATQFGVTLMTLRQALSALEAKGLIWAARGKGTFVADKPVDVRFDNLSSFTAQMEAEGVDLKTKILSVKTAPAEEWSAAAVALGATDTVARVTRLRLVGDVPVSLQRSYLGNAAVSANELSDLGDNSLYELLEERVGSVVAEAKETVTAIALSDSDAVLLDADPGQPALLSVRVSIDQFSRPFLYDEATLVGGRSSIVANRTSEKLSLRYGLAED